MHAQMQEAHSMRQLELAKSTNIDKLVSEYLYFVNRRLFVILWHLEPFRKEHWWGWGGGGGGVEVRVDGGRG